MAVQNREYKNMIDNMVHETANGIILISDKSIRNDDAFVFCVVGEGKELR